MGYDVVVIGGGIAAASFVSSLSTRAPKTRILVLDKATRPGGRLGARSLHLPTGTHEVDIGAAYLTATSEEFRQQVQAWLEQDLLREWTQTLWVFQGDQRVEPSTGPMRYAAAGGLRSLVTNYFDKFAQESPQVIEYRPNSPVHDLAELDELSPRVVVFACPTQQALRVIEKTNTATISPEQRAELEAFRSQPVITAWASFAEATWSDFRAAFVNENKVLSLLADDGSRRGDSAPVLVAHSSHEFAEKHQDGQGTAEELMRESMKLLDFDARPANQGQHRWGLATPTFTSNEPYWFDGHRLTICGDEWGGQSKVETAWLSGAQLGRFVAESKFG
jgi:predicted NAD/FAD-dependent oxidoreductase